MTQTAQGRWFPPASPLIDHLADQLRPAGQARHRPAGRADLAVLRRQARDLDRVDPAAAAIVYKWVGASRIAQDAGMLTACLWATWHRPYDRPVNADGVNVGAALRRLPPDRAARLFNELSTATEPTLPVALYHTIAALSGAGAALDWRQLHHDIRQWLYGYARPVLRRWATGLYSPNTDTAVNQEEAENQ